MPINNTEIDWKYIFNQVDNTIDKGEGGITQKEYYALNVRIFTIVSARYSDDQSDFLRIFFRNFYQSAKIWLQDLKQTQINKLELPWSIIMGYLTIPDLVKMKTLNFQFNNAININKKIIVKIKFLDGILAYFNRTQFKRNWEIYLSFVGLDHFWDNNKNNDPKIYDLLLYLLFNQT
jgi:hypothetical protein